MASIHPFRALRPAPAAAAAVSSVPYDVVSTDEARQLAAGNPLSFLHVTRSEIDLPPDTDPYSPRGLRQGARRISPRCVTSAPLVVDDAPSLYFYRLRMGAHEQTGIAGCFSLDEYDRDVIKKHERTRRDKEDDRTRHIDRAAGADRRRLPDLSRRADGRSTAARPVTAGDAAVRLHRRRRRAAHDLAGRSGADHGASWPPSRGSRRSILRTGIIARPAPRARARSSRSAGSNAATGADTFIAVAFPDNQVQILPYNRTVKDLGRRDAAAVPRRR